MTNKAKIINDIRQVAAKLKKTPTRTQYHRDGHGHFSEHAIKREFGTWASAIQDCGLAMIEKPRITSDDGFKIAQNIEEIKSLKEQVRDLEEDALSGKKIKEIVGSVDIDTLGSDTDWLKGARKERSEGVSGIPTLLLSDWHLDEVVNKAQVRGMNEYNREIAEKRMEFTFTYAVKLLKQYLSKPNYEGIICPLGGDMVSGNIHEELTETNDARINKTIIHWSDKVASGISLLADEFGKVFVPCVVGNHGRHHKKPRCKNRVIDNYEWIMYQIIARALGSDKRISFMIPEADDAFYTVYGHRICLTHGNQFSGGNGVGGIMVPILRGLGKKQTREAAVNNNFMLTLMGHWHQYIHTKSLLINGAGKGYDEYAFINNFPYEDPTQALFIHHRDRGVIFPMSINCAGYEDVKKNNSKSIVWD